MAAILRMSKRKIQTKGILVMKKRLLSLLLVACMLLSMVPMFSAVAIAEEMPAGEATEPYDYSKLYVKDGLKLLYMAFAGQSSVDMAEGKWKDLSGNGNDGSFVNAAASATGPAVNWETNRNGKNGVGYDMLGGSVAADGTWTTTANYNMEADVRLNLPVSVLTALNDGAYTLDYVVEWHNVLYYKADGSLSTHADTYTGGGFWAKPVEQIGSLWHMACRGSSLAFGGTAYGNGRWSFAGSAWYGGQYNNNQLYSETTLMSTRETIARQTIARTRTDNIKYDIYAFYTYNEETSAWDTYAGAASVESWKKYSTTALPVEGVTYKMTSKEETLDNTKTKILVITYDVGGVETTLIDTIHANVIPDMEGLVGKEFRMVKETRTTTKIGMTLARNGAVVKSGTYYTDWLASSSSSSKAGYANKSMNYYVADAVGNQFFLFASAPCTVYSVRFYDRPLEEHEVQQNHFADLCAYYKLDLGDFLSYSADVQKMVYAAFENYEIGEGDYDEAKLALQVYMNLAASGTYDYTSLYHKDGLVALYTSFINDKNVNLSTGVWANSVAGGASARLSNPTKWDRNGFGATGFSQQKVTGALSNNTVFFELPYEYITGDSYTIDTFVNIRRHIDANGNFLGNTSTQDVSRHTGTYVFRLDSFNLMGPVAANGQFRLLYSNYTVDVLGGMKDPLENKLNIYANAAEISPVEIRTYYYAPMSNGSKYDDRKFDLVNNSLTGPQYVGPFAIYKSTANGVSTFKLYNEVGSVQASYKVEDMQKAKGTTVTYNDGTQDVTVNKAAGISISNSFLFGDYPVYIYAVRVYNDLLTEQEKLQNYFADIAAFYGLDMTEFEKASDEVKKKVYAGVGKAFMSLTHQNDDLVLYAEEREAAQASLDAFFTARLVNEYDLLYVGMDGSETANGGRLTMYLSAMAGTNSAIPGIGTWYDKIGGHDATFVSSKAVIWAMRGENGVGYDMLGGSLKEDGTYNTSSNYNFTNEVTLTLDLEALKALSDGGYNLDAVAEYHSLLWYNQNGILQSGAYNNNTLGDYTTYSEWIGNLKNIYNRADIQQDLYARQVRWYLAPGGTGWGGGQYYFNGQLHNEQTRLGGGISTYSFVRTLVEKDKEFGTWIFTYKDGSTVEIGKDKLASYSDGNTKSFLVDGTEYQIEAASRVTKESNGNEIKHSYYEIFVGDTKVATNLYYKYEYLAGGGLATVVCDEMFNSLKEGTVTVTEGETTTSEYTLAINEDFAGVKSGTYYTNSLVTSSSDSTRADYANNSLNGYVKDSAATKFEMFHRAPCSIYGIRLYDAPLTDAENAQNHFADLCAYYLVDISGFADASEAAKATAYAAVKSLTLLEENDKDYVATKAKVQGAVDKAKSVAFEADATLPTEIEGIDNRVVALWTDGSKSYLPGTTLEEGAPLYPVLVSKGETVDGAGVNLANGGLRFKTTFAASDYYVLGKLLGNQNVGLSMIIAPELLVEEKGGVFTKEALGEGNYVKVDINGYYAMEGDTYTFAAGIANLTDVTKDNDLAFAAVLCITLNVGNKTYEIYGDYNAETNRSGLDILTPYVEGVIAGTETVAGDLAKNLYDMYVSFASHKPALAASLESKLKLGLK